jgi:hypothetical protein
MFIIKYKSKDAKLEELEDRFRELSLAFKIEQVDQVEELTLFDGTLQVVGYEAIKSHLDQLSGELRHWYYCGC